MANQLMAIIVTALLAASAIFTGPTFAAPVDEEPASVNSYDGVPHVPQPLYTPEPESQDFLQQVNVPLEKLSGTLMSPHIPSDVKPNYETMVTANYGMADNYNSADNNNAAAYQPVVTDNYNSADNNAAAYQPVVTDNAYQPVVTDNAYQPVVTDTPYQTLIASPYVTVKTGIDSETGAIGANHKIALSAGGDTVSVGAAGVHSSGQFSAQLPVVHTSSLLEVSKDGLTGVLKAPFVVSSKTASVGAAIPAAAAVKGTVVGSAIATPIILKSIALPGVAAVKTAGMLSIPNIFASRLHSVGQSVTSGLKAFPEKFLSETSDKFASLKSALQLNDTAFSGAADFFDGQQLFVIPTEVEIAADDAKLADTGSLLVNKTHEELAKVGGIVKAGALGVGSVVKAGALGLKAGAVAVKAGALALAAKPVILAKKVAYVAGRLIMKPVAIVTGAHLKALGSGLKLAGKLIGGTGSGIAKVGKVVKYTGLGAIGAGASSVAWGFDKTTLGAHQTLLAVDTTGAGVDSNVQVTAEI